MATREQKSEQPSAEDIGQSRRTTLRRLGRFATITPPAVTLLLAAKIRPAVAASGASSRQLKEPVLVAQLADQASVDKSRRAALRRLGRFAAVTPPAVALLLAAGTRPSKALPISEVPSSRQFKEPVSVAQLQ